MPAFNPRSFTSPDRLKSISAKRLLAFFQIWDGYFRDRGLILPTAAADNFPFDELAGILLRPDESVPEAMVDALFYVHETASKESMEELQDRAQSEGLDVDLDEDPSPADLALQIWLLNPELLRRQHAETVAFNRSRFQYFAGKSVRRPPRPLDPSSDKLALIAVRLDEWFMMRRRGGQCRVFAFPRESKTWFLIRHGEPIRREGRHQDDGSPGIAVYRPQKHDVLIFDADTGELAVNAGTKGEVKLYLSSVGAILFDDEAHFVPASRFTLAPLLENGPAALENDTVPEIIRVRLIEIERFWGGKAKEKEVRKATDLFLAWGEDWKSRLVRGSIDRVMLKIKFDGDGKERTVALLPPGLARYDRDADSDLIDRWLKDQGFCGPVMEDEDDDAGVLEDD